MKSLRSTESGEKWRLSNFICMTVWPCHYTENTAGSQLKVTGGQICDIKRSPRGKGFSRTAKTPFYLLLSTEPSPWHPESCQVPSCPRKKKATQSRPKSRKHWQLQSARIQPGVGDRPQKRCDFKAPPRMRGVVRPRSEHLTAATNPAALGRAPAVQGEQCRFQELFRNREASQGTTTAV